MPRAIQIILAKSHGLLLSPSRSEGEPHDFNHWDVRPLIALGEVSDETLLFCLRKTSLSLPRSRNDPLPTEERRGLIQGMQRGR